MGSGLQWSAVDDPDGRPTATNESQHHHTQRIRIVMAEHPGAHGRTGATSSPTTPASPTSEASTDASLKRPRQNAASPSVGVARRRGAWPWWPSSSASSQSSTVPQHSRPGDATPSPSGLKLAPTNLDIPQPVGVGARPDPHRQRVRRPRGPGREQPGRARARRQLGGERGRTDLHVPPQRGHELLQRGRTQRRRRGLVHPGTGGQAVP